MTSTAISLLTRNCRSVDVGAVPTLPFEEFGDELVRRVEAGATVSAFFGVPEARLTTESEGKLRVFAVLAQPEESTISVFSTRVGASYQSLTPRCTSLHWFEREIAEQWGIRPEGHPWLKPIRFQPSCVAARSGDKPPAIGVTDFFQVVSDEIHEVAVGPVHAGIIEPGHFRFQCYGEQVYHLEISLGYQHRGVEAALLRNPPKRHIHYMETLAGDTTVGHASAYCQAHESLANCHVPVRALALRGICLELERLANHTGDLGALANDVGYLPTASFCGRIRGDFLNLSALICGNRFGRGMTIPGGVGFDLEPTRAKELDRRLVQAGKDVTGAAALLWETPSILTRFENIGTLGKKACMDLGIVGTAARAAGLSRDVRSDFPVGIFRFAQTPVSTCQSGDVFGRAFVRGLEIQRSVEFIRSQIDTLPESDIHVQPGELKPNRLVVSLVEGWRGEICHVALTDREGRLAHYKVVDPSFHNWMGLAFALRGQQISDFPLCNKSFNLSYCGHDL